MKTKSYEA